MVESSVQIGGENYVLTFNDEFDDSAVSFWNGYGHGSIWATSFSPHLDDTRYLWSNNEQQYYFDPAMEGFQSPFTAEDGTITIHASALDPSQQPLADGQAYSSGLLTTEMSFSTNGGYLEIRADVPDEQGFWSSFWLLPADGDWSSEIDVFEILGQSADTVHTNVWIDGYDDPEAITGTGAGTGFHTYGLLWSDNSLQWTIDGVVVRTEDYGLNEDIYLAISLAVGGWAGSPDATTDFSDGLSIDYVRVYELESDPHRNEAITDGQYIGRDFGKGSDIDDVIFGSRWADVLAAGAGDDLVYGRKGRDQLSGGDGDDEIYGQKGADTLNGNAGNDKLIGGKNQDVLNGGTGTDHLWGGVYNGDGATDRFVFDDQTDKDFVHGFEAGTDLIDLSALGVDWSGVQAMLYDYGWATKINLGQVTGDFGDMVYLVGVAESVLSEDDFVLSIA
ncbi:MAG: family 16 glycosylhydrolase [Pseudomonadota bacterium]